MNVLLVSASFPTNTGSMAGVMVRELAEAIRAEGVDLRVAHLSERMVWPFRLLPGYRRSRAAEDEDHLPWVIHHVVPALPGAVGLTRRAAGWASGLMSAVTRQWRQFVPDLIHARTFIRGGIPAAEWAKREAIPLVVSSHGADTRVFVHQRQARAALLRVAAAARRIVCVSEPIAEALRAHGVPPPKIRLVYNGMDLSKVILRNDPGRLTRTGYPTVAAVGNLVPSKGHDDLLRAVAMLRPDYPDLRCVVVGDGKQRRCLRRLCTRLGLLDRVEFAGRLPPREAMAFMDACDIFCLPAWSEGFGIVYLEAMAHGKPVIAVEGQGIARIVSRYGCGLLVPPHDASAVASAIRQLLDNPATRQHMGTLGRQAVREDFSWARCAREMIGVYLEAQEQART